MEIGREVAISYTISSDAAVFGKVPRGPVRRPYPPREGESMSSASSWPGMRSNPVRTGYPGRKASGAIAQLEERLVCIQKARGSSPLSSTG